MKKIYLENGYEKTINKLSDLPKMTSKLLDVNLKLYRNGLNHNGFGIPTLILFLFFLKSIPKILVGRKIRLMLWNISEDLRVIEDLHGVENVPEYNYLFLARQKEAKIKLELIKKVNSNLSKISWLEKLFIRKIMNNFYKEINPLIYDDTEGDKSRRFGYSAHFLYNIFARDFKIHTEEIEKAIIKIENPH